MEKQAPISDDQSILSQLRHGATASRAIAMLYESYCEDLTRLTVSLGGSRDDGADVFQDVVVAFVHLVQGGRYRGEAGVRTMLHAMARNKWNNELRRRGRSQARAEVYEQTQTELVPGTQQLLEHKEATQGLQALLAELGPSCKDLLTDFYYAQRSMQELAKAQGLGSEQAARNKKSRCLKKLTDLLETRPALTLQLKNLFYGTE